MHTRVLVCSTLLKGHTVVYGMVSRLAVYQKALRAATVMLISEIIARAPTMGRNGRSVVCGISSLLVARREVPRAATVLISEIIALAPLTMGVIEPTVVYGTVNLFVACPEVLHVATMLISEIIAQAPKMGRTIVSAQRVMAGYFAGKAQAKFISASQIK